MLNTEIREKGREPRDKAVKKFPFLIFFSSTYIDCIISVFIVYESESPRAPCLVVVDDLDLLDWSILREQLPYLLLPCVQAKAKHAYHSARAGVELEKYKSNERGIVTTIVGCIS